MKARNTWELENRLDLSLGPRKRELTEHRFAVMGGGSFRRGVLRRSGIVLMYAHWEGFVREASSLYLSLVDSRGLPVAELARNFQAIALRTTLLRLGATRKVSRHIELLNDIADAMKLPQAPARMPTNGIIAERSNLDARAFYEILETLGLDPTPYKLQEKPVIGRLVRLRHQIAHGARVPVDFSTYNDLHAHLISILDVFREQIVRAAVGRLFLAGPNMS